MSDAERSINARPLRRTLMLAAAAWPMLAWTGAVCAQGPASGRRIGLLSPYSAAESAPWFQAFRQGLRELGWAEGKNIGIEYRYAQGNSDLLRKHVAEIVRLQVDAIVATNSTDAGAAKRATRTIPIVMANAGDPVAQGMVESLARPGGNITGLSQMSLDLTGKRLELLTEVVPKLSRAAVLGNQGNISVLGWKEIQAPTKQLGVQVHWLEAGNPKAFGSAFEDAIKLQAGALYVTSSGVFSANLKRIADLAAKARLPSIYHRSEFADAGGLMSYGPDRADMFRRAATYVDKILKGAKPADLPVEQPTKFELVVNMKTAKALGLTIPQTVLVRTDRLIE